MTGNSGRSSKLRLKDEVLVGLQRLWRLELRNRTHYVRCGTPWRRNRRRLRLAQLWNGFEWRVLL